MAQAVVASNVDPDEGSASDTDLTAARAGDEAAFTRLMAPLHRELLAHCYRMLGSFHDAEDAVQETFVRAWKGLARFEGRSTLRSWLYTVATRACLDTVKARKRRALPMDLGPAADHTVLDSAPLADADWLTPYPDSQPEERSERRDTMELAFIAALQHLPGNQRAALLLFDVLDFSAAEIAEVMETSSTSVNSALARARRTIAATVPSLSSRNDAFAVSGDEARTIAIRFATALEEGDIDTFVSLLTQDVTWTMPPLPHWYSGIGRVADFALTVPMTLCPSWRHRIVWANRQPSVAFYLGQDESSVHEAWSITVLGLREDRISMITSFLGPDHFGAFGLPLSTP
ncbi:RNA polymerase sigma-70 factor, ECF subfamily [Sinosporangium album]|uniref:RNA polymerase sigma-70 factor, ECF subfamily n=1 Tax=Sinosporangium album TaxID=504805 RepID=A0A1G7QR85_9ACTN|nr:sigma-70 family RNA polymerase sigma factor [Sinosporangium album]SDG00993.1 RNA polymerase sigma-70 factor, ECF subfamily [Sinosporangium album]